jgi:hypothetical protein
LHVELTPDLEWIGVGPEPRDHAARTHAQSLDHTQRIDQIVAQTLGDVGVVGAAEILERQYGDRLVAHGRARADRGLGSRLCRGQRGVALHQRCERREHFVGTGVTIRRLARHAALDDLGNPCWELRSEAARVRRRLGQSRRRYRDRGIA